MPTRILKYLDRMDVLREETDKRVDEMLKKINVRLLMRDPEKMLKIIVVKFLKDNNRLFKEASKEGLKLARSLNVKD